MATITTQDKYVESKINEISTIYDSIEQLYKKLNSEKGKARGSVAEDEYYYVLEGIKHIVNTALTYRISAVKTLIHNNKVLSRMR